MPKFKTQKLENINTKKPKIQSKISIPKNPKKSKIQKYKNSKFKKFKK